MADFFHELNTDLSATNTAIQGKAPSDHTHDGRYYTESEVDNLLSSLGPLNPKGSKIVVGSFSIVLNAGNGMAHHIISIDKYINQFMPFLIYNDSCYNCPVFMSSGISGKNATVFLIPKDMPSSAQTYNIWYLAITGK